MPSRYSNDVASLVSRMLNKHGTHRPSVESILQSSHVQNNLNHLPSEELGVDHEGHTTEAFNLVRTIKMPFQMPGRSLRLQLPGKSYPDRESARASPTRDAEMQRTPSDPEVRKFASPSKVQKPERAHTSPGLARMKLPNLRAERGRIGNSKSGVRKVRRAPKQKSRRNPPQNSENWNPNQRPALFSKYGRPSVPSASGYSRHAARYGGYYGANRVHGRGWVNPTRPW